MPLLVFFLPTTRTNSDEYCSSFCCRTCCWCKKNTQQRHGEAFVKGEDQRRRNDDQDAASSPNYYKFTKYDALSRPIMTGTVYDIGTNTRQTIQSAFDIHDEETYEVTGTTILGYTNRSFPDDYRPEEIEAKTVVYYDNYNWQTNNDYDFQINTAFHNLGLTKGLITGTQVRNLDTNVWYKFVNYYDYKGRNIQNFTQNHLGGIDRTDYQYRFNNEVLIMRMEHQGINEIYRYEYDHLGHKTAFKHTLGGTLKNVARYEYDEIGRLQTKKLSPTNDIGTQASGEWNDTNVWLNGLVPSVNDHVFINQTHTITIPNGQAGSAGSLFLGGTLNNYGRLDLGKLPTIYGEGDLQTIDYSYHIRGGLRGINLDASGNLTNKLFSMKLGYEDANFFDGNIGKQEWKTSFDNVTRSYTYGYDGASRITGGLYVGTGSENYSLNSVSYDLNGNIKTLSRNGLKSNNSFGLIDNLAYTYDLNSNKIQKVDDTSNEIASFKDVSGNDYTYSLDGSLTSDANKGTTSIEYNYLKRPKKYTFSNGSTLENQYDATGKKLKSISSDGITYDFLGNLIYKNNVLYQISHDEGRIINGEYEYEIKDHLGNLRVSFRDSLGIAKITQKQDYDVFGQELRGIGFSKPNPNKFTYQGKEFSSETGDYDFGARMYDPVIGRWGVIDPMAEKWSSYSLYNFSLNNPILYTDPDGRDVGFSKAGETIDKKTRVTTITYNINVSMSIMNSSSMNSKDYQSAVSSFTNQLTKSLTGSFNAGDKTRISFQAGDIDVRSVSSMSDVKSTDHLMIVVDNVTGMDAKGGQAGGLADVGGKIAYVEAGNVSGVAGNMIHEFGHNMGLSHNFETSNKGDDGASNYMGYGNVRNQFAGVQLLQSLNKSNAQPSQLNIGNNYEILKQDFNTNGRTTQQMPLQYNVGRGGRIPRTLKN